MSVLFRQVRLLDRAAAEGLSPPCDVHVEGPRIAAVGTELAAKGARLVEGHGKLLLPGLINAHFHSPVNHMKGRLDSLPLELFMLYESPALETLRPGPREAYIRTLLACAEMLRGGVTSVQDDAFFLPDPTPDIIDAVMQAYADSGMRVNLALDEPELAELDKLPFLRELMPAAARAGLETARDTGFLMEAYQHLISRWHGTQGGRLRAAVSCSAPQRVSPRYMRALDDISRALDVPYFAHMLETKLQRVLGEERLGGRSLIRYAADEGLLSARLNIIHAIWVDGADLDLVASAGSTIAHNPISNLRLGSGVMPFRAIRARGIPICLGTDEAIADDAVNMWAVAKMAGLIHNITTPDPNEWPKAWEVLDCLFTGGARAMGLADDLGAVEPGRLADLTLVDLETLPFTPLNDTARQLVYCEDGRSVVATMVAGDFVFEAGRCTRIDEAALIAEARELFARRRPALELAASEAGRLRPWYEAMVGRAAARDVGMNRWVSA
ncbi:amidohydrolase family protein [Ancylobacter sp. VNQ12]|uniref:amidohydrolase family protein n=1 Tax=Ancylobacter sp. VNQ12 TaxID=3400920 RepID=UPI003BFE7CF1